MTLAALIERIECLKETAECDAVWWHELAEHWPTIRDAIKRYEEALQSISGNSCCKPCREAALVANKALHPPEAP